MNGTIGQFSQVNASGLPAVIGSNIGIVRTCMKRTARDFITIVVGELRVQVSACKLARKVTGTAWVSRISRANFWSKLLVSTAGV